MVLMLRQPIELSVVIRTLNTRGRRGTAVNDDTFASWRTR